MKAARFDVEGEPRITAHERCRSFGALLLDAGMSVAVVSPIMGHSNEAITQAIHSHEIQRRESRERTRAGLQAALDRPVFGTNLERSGGEARAIEGVPETAGVVGIPP